MTHHPITGAAFRKLLAELFTANPDNAVLAAHVAAPGRLYPTPMADAALHAWRKSILTAAGLRGATQRLTTRN